MNITKILIATRNKHKLTEIRSIFSAIQVELIGADEFGSLPEVEEDADTFEGNAIKKARTLCDATGMWTLADDSGLEVDALDGAPGVYSARYAGEPSNTPANNAKLLRELADKPNRTARFRCVIAIAAPDGREWTVDGRCEGKIALTPSGNAGFGYDPLFIPDGYSVSFADMPAEQKNSISHRGRALAKAAELISKL